MKHNVFAEERRYLHQSHYMLIFRIYKTKINKQMTDNSVFKKLICHEQVFDEEAIVNKNRREESSISSIFYSFELEVGTWIFDLLIYIFHYLAYNHLHVYRYCLLKSEL